MAACIQGDHAALEKFVLDYREVVHRAAVEAIDRVGKSAVSCAPEDLVDEFFLMVVRDPSGMLESFNADRGRLRTWLMSVVRRQCFRMLRSPMFGWPGVGPVLQTLNMDTLADRAEHESHAAEAVQRLVDHLDAESRRVIQARYGLWPFFKPLPVCEIADERGWSLATTYRRLAEILSRLRAIAESSGEEFDL